MANATDTANVIIRPPIAWAVAALSRKQSDQKQLATASPHWEGEGRSRFGNTMPVIGGNSEVSALRELGESRSREDCGTRWWVPVPRSTSPLAVRQQIR